MDSRKWYFDQDWIHALVPTDLGHELLEVVFQVFEDQQQFLIGVNHLLELDDVGVAEFLQDGDLSNGGAGDALLLGLQADLL